MPLIPTLLETALKTQIEAKLKIEFKKPSVKESLRTQIDGGSLAGFKSDAENLSDAYDNIKDKTENILSYTPDLPGSDVLSQELIKRIVSNEHANAISDAICEWLSDTIAPIVAKELSAIIATEVTTYIKTVTVIVPPGQAVVGALGAGATTTPSPPAIIT